MQRRHLLILTLISSLLAAGSALALDLTGTWEGKESCLVLNDDDYVETKRKGQSTFVITQSGEDLNVTVIGDFLVATMDGAALARADNPDAGRAGIYRCGTTPTLSMTGAFKAKSSASGSGTLEGTVNVVGHGSGDAVATCKYALKRTSTANPNVLPCP